jgi:hypothetical protein
MNQIIYLLEKNKIIMLFQITLPMSDIYIKKINRIKLYNMQVEA